MFMSAEYGNVQTALIALLLLQYALMAYAAWRDARTRTFPNALAAAFVAVCAVVAFLGGGLTDLSVPDGLGGLQDGGFIVTAGLQALARHAIAASVVFAVLYVFELIWRNFRGQSGLGMGDLKFLFALMLAEPVKAFIAFFLGLIALAVTGTATRKSSLPFLPFVVGSYFAVLLSGLFITLGM